METVAPESHAERHFNASLLLRDVVIGMSDGLTVPFALAAGISGAIAANHVVVTAGIAEIVAGSIAMGFGGYLAARTDVDRYRTEYRRETREAREMPDEERAEVRGIFAEFGLGDAELDSLVEHIASDHKRWVEFMMRFELGLEEPDPRRAPVSAATIAASYAIGGVIPLIPYMALGDVGTALAVSCVCTGTALALFGAVKARFTGAPPVTGALQTFLTGGVAAAAAFFLTRLVR